MTYLEEQLAQVKSIVAHSSERQDKPAKRHVQENHQTKSCTSSKISSNNKHMKHFEHSRSRMIESKADIQPNNQENMKLLTLNDKGKNSSDSSNLWYIDNGPSSKTYIPEIESNKNLKRKDKNRSRASDYIEKEEKQKRKAARRNSSSANSNTNIASSGFQKQNEKQGADSGRKSHKKMLAEYWKPVDELEWGKNLYLIGDIFWNSFVKCAKIKTKMAKMEKLYTGHGKSSSGNFRLLVRRENERIRGLYDDVREKLLFPLPPRIKMVCVSIGAHDVLNVAKLSNGKEQSEENKINGNKDETVVFTSNDIRKIFADLANSIKNMVRKLHDMNKSVLLLVPYSNENLELFDMWQNVIKEITSSFPFPEFRILYLSEIMKSTISEFESPQEMFESWIANKNENSFSLSEYGCVRLFHALEESIISTSPSITENIRLPL